MPSAMVAHSSGALTAGRCVFTGLRGMVPPKVSLFGAARVRPALLTALDESSRVAVQSKQPRWGMGEANENPKGSPILYRGRDDPRAGHGDGQCAGEDDRAGQAAYRHER